MTEKKKSKLSETYKTKKNNTVAINDSLNSSSTNLIKSEVFPTPLSPTSKNLNI